LNLETGIETADYAEFADDQAFAKDMALAQLVSRSPWRKNPPKSFNPRQSAKSAVIPIAALRLNSSIQLSIIFTGIATATPLAIRRGRRQECR
jgi:hypothetical protein